MCCEACTRPPILPVPSTRASQPARLSSHAPSSTDASPASRRGDFAVPNRPHTETLHRFEAAARALSAPMSGVRRLRGGSRDAHACSTRLTSSDSRHRGLSPSQCCPWHLISPSIDYEKGTSALCSLADAPVLDWDASAAVGLTLALAGASADCGRDRRLVVAPRTLLVADCLSFTGCAFRRLATSAVPSLLLRTAVWGRHLPSARPS